MKHIIDNFNISFQRVEELGGLHSALGLLTTTAVDASDLLRAQIVLGVSALDYFVHELTVAGMLEIYDGIRPTTDSFEKFKVPLIALIGNQVMQMNRVNFENVIRERHSFLSFQQPDKIAEAVRLFSSIELWNHVASQVNISAKEIKERLRLIVDRRNKIAHEADIDPTYPGSRWPINVSDVRQTLDFIKTICTAINDVVV